MTNDDTPAADEAELDGLAPPQQNTRIEQPDVEADGPEWVSDDEFDAAEEAAEQSEAPETEEITELSDEERESLRMLVTVGRTTRKFVLFEHEILISTLNSDEEIRAFREAAKDEGTAAYPRSYQTAMIAAAVKSVDGVSWENTLVENPGPEVIYDQKLVKARKLYPLVVQYIYNELLELNTEFGELARKLGKLKG